MQISSSLSAIELASIERALSNHVAEKGLSILGSQLGLLLAQAIKPRPLHELGGLKNITANALKEYVRLQETQTTADVVYEILTAISARPLPESLAASSRGEVEVAGRDLWRLFSNPRINCTLLIDSDARIYVSFLAHERPSQHKILAKPDGEQFRALAEQFAEQQADLAVKSFLKDAVSKKDYYDEWIKELRRLRTPSSNLLREWESLRSEFVASKLHAGLLACGVDEARAAEIVRLARPSFPNRTHASHRSGTQVMSVPQASSTLRADSVGAPTDSEDFRQMIHRAIDLMSLSELRELKIAAGLLYDASRTTPQ